MLRNFDILSDPCNIECRKSGALYCLWNGGIVNLQSAMILLSIFLFIFYINFTCRGNNSWLVLQSVT